MEDNVGVRKGRKGEVIGGRESEEEEKMRKRGNYGRKGRREEKEKV